MREYLESAAHDGLSKIRAAMELVDRTCEYYNQTIMAVAYTQVIIKCAAREWKDTKRLETGSEMRVSGAKGALADFDRSFAQRDGFVIVSLWEKY